MKYKHCVCMTESWYLTATGCPPGMVPVTQCPPKIPKRDETCCALIVLEKKQYIRQAFEGDDDWRQTNKETKKTPTKKPRKFKVIKGGSIVRILRVFDG